jgi:hypothetical protein
MRAHIDSITLNVNDFALMAPGSRARTVLLKRAIGHCSARASSMDRNAD